MLLHFRTQAELRGTEMPGISALLRVGAAPLGRQVGGPNLRLPDEYSATRGR